jgi:MFS family permease
MLPAAVAVPFAVVLVDRYQRQAVLFWMHVLRALTLGLAAFLIASEGPALAVYAAAAAAALFGSVFRPAQWALLPPLARTPRELVAGNVSSSLLEGIAVFAGPAVAGILIALSGTSIVFLISALCSLVAGLAVGGITTQSQTAPVEDVAPHVTDELLAGARLVAKHPQQRMLIGLFAAQTLVRGFLNVLIVVASIELLDSGESGVGFLNAAFGIGGLIGAFAAISLVDRERLGPSVALALVLWGAPISLIGILPEIGAALLALAVVGAGNAVLDISGVTLLQRATPEHVQGRVFGVLETLAMLFVAVGALLSPLLVEVLGVRGALVATGALLPALALTFRRPLDHVDATITLPLEEMALLRSIPVFAPLDGGTLQQLAMHLERVPALAGAEVIRQGDHGDRFYVIARGTMRVSTDGRVTARLRPGNFFGEIALLRDVPRTATVTAETDALLYALERDIFISAVSGHPQSAETVDAAIASRTIALRVPTAPL